MLLTFCTMFRSWNLFLLGLSWLSPLLDHLLVSNPFFVILPPLTFTAGFSLSSLNFCHCCLPQFSLYNLSLGSLDSESSAVVGFWCFSYLLLHSARRNLAGFDSSGSALQHAHFYDFWLTQTGKVSVLFAVTFYDKITSLTEELNLLILFCHSWLLRPLPLVFPKHIPFVTTGNCSVKTTFLSCHFNVSSNSLFLPHQI